MQTGRRPGRSYRCILPRPAAPQSCPIQDDPERGECFQHKMILRMQRWGQGTLRLTMQHAERLTLAECESFSPATLSASGAGRRQIYGLVERTLRAQRTCGCLVRRYLAKIGSQPAAPDSTVSPQPRVSRRRFTTPNGLAAVDGRRAGAGGASHPREYTTTRPPING